MGIFDKIFGRGNLNDLIVAFNIYVSNSQWREVIKYGEELAQIFKNRGNKAGESTCYTNLGVAYRSLGDFNKAIEFHEKSLEINKEIGDKVVESACYTNLGNAYRSLGDFNKAIEFHEKSLEINKEIGDKAEESKCYTNLGNAYRSLGDFNKAIEFHEKSLEINKKNGVKSVESACYGNLGNAYHGLGDYNKAIEFHEKSLEINKEIGVKSGESACYGNLGAAYYSLGDYNKAIEFYKKSLEIDKEIGDGAGESGCYGNLGNAYYRLSDFNKAIEFHKKSLEINKEIGDKAGKSKCYGNLGAVYYSLGDFNKAIEFYKKSLEINKEIGDVVGESGCYGNLGAAYYSLGDYNKAIQSHKKSLEINKEIGDKSGESGCYTNLGIAYYSLGDYNKAIEFHEKSLEINKEIGAVAGEAKCYGNLGAAYYSLGDYNKAIEFHEKSLEINKEIGDKSGESACYGNLGNAYHGLGDYNKAIEFHEKSLEINKEIGAVAGEAKCYGNLGAVYFSLRDFNKAIQSHKKSLEINKEIGDVAGESTGYTNLGIAYYSLGDFNKSLDYSKKSIKLAEIVRETLAEEELSLKFLKTKIGVYDLAIDSAVNLYKKTNEKLYLKEALEIIERTKSRELMKIIKAKKKDPEVEKEYGELKDVDTKIAELEVMIKSALEGKRSIEREVKEKNELYEKRAELYKKIREKSLDPSSIVPGIDEEIIKEFWDVFEKHADNCTVLQIYEQKERIIYVLFDKEKFEFFEKEITRAKREKVLSALKIIRSSFISEDTCYGILGQVLDDILPKSLKEGLGNIKTKELFVIPHSWLHQIPWEAVVVDEKPLCIKYNLIRHYSLDLLRSSLKYDEKENKNALLVSNPKPSKKQDLPGAEIECSTINEALAKLSYNPTHLNRESARIEDIENQLSDISIVHFSCHGLFNTEDPFESSIILSSDKELSANKISLKNLDYYPLVFLNACESGITKSDESTAGVGDEQIGLVRAFAMAHSPSIIVTGWEIDVDVAEYFAKQFYGALSDNNLIDALTSAREKTHKKFVDKSKDWAAYVLYGNPYRKL